MWRQWSPGADPQPAGFAGGAGAVAAQHASGTSHAITTILNYAIIAIGAMTVFGALGVSRDKLQWLAAALSVGLGFWPAGDLR
ncbi:mechanosensitive ion channel [Klebsiella pneumoniae subsp. pneumoniae]|nr:mechanosensitive ion channel [Klebsiella pneumoniae subsp. pneumoniae]